MVSKIERRKYVRILFGAGCKIANRQTGGFHAGRVLDVSEGGVGLAVDGARPLNVGEKVDVGVDWSGRMLVATTAMISGTVVRVGPERDGRQFVGIGFDSAADLTLRMRSAA